MRSELFLANLARGRFIGTRVTAATLREQVEIALAQGNEVVPLKTPQDTP